MKSGILTTGPLPQIRQLEMLTVLLLIHVCGLASMTLGKSCSPVSCSPGFQIISCNQDGEKDKCEPCPQYKTQPYNVSSKDDDDYHRCFSVNPDDCRQTGVINSRWRDRSQCSESCECDFANCYAGKTACDCQQYQPCDIHQQMNRETGACEPCPPNTYKNERGCYPCQYDLDGTRTRIIVSPLARPSSPEINKTSATTGSGIYTQDTSSDPPNPITPPTNATAKERLSSGDGTFCVNNIVLIIFGVLLLVIVIMVVGKWQIRKRRLRRDSWISNVSRDTEANKPNPIILIQESSMLIKIKDNNANTAREFEATNKCTEDGVNQRSSQDDQVVKPDVKREATEAQDSGYWTRLESSTSSFPNSHQRNSCPSQDSDVSRQSENLTCLLSGTSAPTEHDEESTHVKTISGGY